MSSPALFQEKSSSVPGADFPPVNQWVVEGGREFVAIDSLEDFEPFFLSLATISNQWLFCSCHGPLSAGRENPEKALFPYLTVDKILDNWNVTGPFTAVSSEGQLWHPFWPTAIHTAPVRRRLLKSVLGEELVFEEFHEAWHLRFRYRWQLSGKFGFVRKVEIINEGGNERSFRIIDGLQDLGVSGVSQRTHLEFSCLADAYKMTETARQGRLMIHRLASGIVDAPIPLEILRATTVWATGFDEAEPFLSRREAQNFLRDTGEGRPAARLRGERGAYFLGGDLVLAPGASRQWMMVAEVEQSHRELGELMVALNDRKSLLAAVETDLEEAREKLRKLAASVDGLEETSDRDTALYHYHNTLCNFLRGGLPEDGTRLTRERLTHFIRQNNRPLAERFREWLTALPDSFERAWVIEEARSTGDRDLLRLTVEYLPLILGRRHGDPSRPWNSFNIRLQDERGETIHHYEGNWRDIFQNWEALAWSYPAFLDGFISRFLNASTIDGFNPYRVTSAGVDWEVPDADDPWVSIGYWGDHQIIYLLKFLEFKEKLSPDFPDHDSGSRLYVFADVPYRLAGWDRTLADSRDTVEFDQERHDRLMQRKDDEGGDGLLLRDRSGKLVRSGLIGKLLIPALAKLGQLIPDGGIWMNTQKPEWNDANNALAGNGLSVVTTAYLLRYLEFLKRTLGKSQADEFLVLEPIRTAVLALTAALRDERWQAGSRTPEERFALARKNARAMENYRAQVAREEIGEAVLTRDELSELVDVASTALKGILTDNRRNDGLWHSYNILESRAEAGQMTIGHLQLMLEGQVAILSSGLLEPREAVALLETLATSELRSKRHPTYLLYPDRELPRFEELNQIPEKALQSVGALARMAGTGDERLVYRDDTGSWRFDDSLVNGYALKECLDRLEDLTPADCAEIEELYEEVFAHHAFTGRSGSMFAYEGLGCVFWHMISKLMLASQEVALSVSRSEASAPLKARAVNAYYGIQRGLGFRQTPRQYGAFPAEPYSHSQGERGAQQPGLTGQVKEGLLCRLGELGVSFEKGCLVFRPTLLRAAEFEGLTGESSLSPLPAGEIRFSYARTPVVYRRDDQRDNFQVSVTSSTGETLTFEGGRLDRRCSEQVAFSEDQITAITVLVPGHMLVS